MSSRYLRRYTDIPALIYLLSERKLTLLDPRSWDDSNDSSYLSLYKEKKRLKSVLALCFTQSGEKYHHWRVFAAGSGGVCIRFMRSKVLEVVRGRDGFRIGDVQYKHLGEIRKKRILAQDLPFLKRYAFEHESEYRIIYESVDEEISKLDVDIPLLAIDRITLSPWIHPDLYQQLKRVLKSIDGCESLKIVRSTLIGNAEWKSLGEKAV